MVGNVNKGRDIGKGWALWSPKLGLDNYVSPTKSALKDGTTLPPSTPESSDTIVSVRVIRTSEYNRLKRIEKERTNASE